MKMLDVGRICGVRYIPQNTDLPEAFMYGLHAS